MTPDWNRSADKLPRLPMPRINRYMLGGVSATLIAGLLAGVFWIAGARSKPGLSTGKQLEGLGDFGTVPDFTLTERSGQRVTRSDLKGQIWLADFIYTTCEDTCPLESATMEKLQTQLKDPRAKLVSISVDPDRDTPNVLARYADVFHADPQRWLFLTGNKNEIYRIVQEGFHLSAIPASDDSEHSDGVFHDAHFVLVDGSAQIRGYYESNDAEALRRLTADIGKLLRENG